MWQGWQMRSGVEMLGNTKQIGGKREQGFAPLQGNRQEYTQVYQAKTGMAASINTI